MIETHQFVQYAQHPELALENLAELLSFMNSEDESAQNLATEALENCGPPSRKELVFLLSQLSSSEESNVYWASTLLGRFKPGGDKERVELQQSLCNAICKLDNTLAARERATWAIGELGSVNQECRRLLSSQIPDAPPRLKRLLESALHI